MEIAALGAVPRQSFGSTVSPWIVTAEALEPFASRNPPAPPAIRARFPICGHDRDQASGAFDMRSEALF